MGRLLCHSVLLLAAFLFLNRGYCLANCLERDVPHKHSCHQKTPQTDCAGSKVQAGLPLSIHIHAPAAVFYPLVAQVTVLAETPVAVVADDSSPPGPHQHRATTLRI